MRKRTLEPYLWILFSAGGVFAAMLMPVLLGLFGIAIPLGWVTAPSVEHLVTTFGFPLARLALFALCALSLFHWAHRFRYTLYDGLQMKHLNRPITLFCYGGAIGGSALAAWLVWQIGA